MHIKTFDTQLKTIDKRFKINATQININEVTYSYVHYSHFLSSCRSSVFWIPREKQRQKSNVFVIKSCAIFYAIFFSDTNNMVGEKIT